MLVFEPALEAVRPVLACLAGVDVVSRNVVKRNADGGVRDEDMFSIGDDEDESAPPRYQVDNDTAECASGNDAGKDNGKTVTGVSQKYYIRKGDTLQGIALRFGVDLIRDAGMGSVISREEEEEREAKRVWERAAKRLQTITKEVDWQVAKAYVALASDEDEEEVCRKRKERGDGKGKGRTLEAVAVERYLDDDEWEQGRNK
ncbi:hypothetical protein BDQ17DRAFT_1327563 [Cyathus striatus]|nr:hypothetical protein BDQ17DRAFT_1327563 [Cyathus striatus]